jgi:NAD-reducing hydrogenase small subunit
VEGAVSTTDDLKKLLKAREHSKLLVALGDCAVTGNVPSMRNTFGRTAVLDTVYIENATIQQQIPREVIPELLKFSKPVHELVKVDVFLPGCPPSADTIFYALQELVAGRVPQFEPTPRFGA